MKELHPVWLPITAIALALIVVWPVSSLAETNHVCRRYVEPVVTIDPIFDELEYNNSTDMGGIMAMYDTLHPNAKKTKELRIGMTSSTPKFETQMEVSSEIAPDGTTCAQVTSLELKYGFTDIIVHIAKDLGESPCVYSMVMQHELRHVNADRELMNIYTPRLSGLLPAFLREMGVIRTKDPESAKQEVYSEIGDYIEQLSSEIMAEHDKRQALIDTPEEYRRLTETCGDDISKLSSGWDTKRP
ncbi:MAG: hypothetical protein PHX43_08730 [Alphaproteobacteria bacterium]|nr:hypothetical protein [Alphaproteobacteria bacterium]